MRQPLNRCRPFAIVIAVALALLTMPSSATAQNPAAMVVESLSSEGATVYRHDKTLWLKLAESSAQQKRVSIPRLRAPIRSIAWKDHPDLEIKFVPEPTEWIFSWSSSPLGGSPVIEVVFDEVPGLVDTQEFVTPKGDGSVMLHAYQASTTGEKLRFEPQWFKNTVGYWTVPSDYATWNVEITQPGTYSVAVLQGCGSGQGGSEALISLRNDDGVMTELSLTTIDTGHFQNFRWNDLGNIEIAEQGHYQLRITPKRIAKAALFDVRAVHLVRQAKSTQ